MLISLVLLVVGSCARQAEISDQGGKKMDVTSIAFQEGEMIPSKYTCDGQNTSPPLAWKSVPEGTKSLALIADDPDAPRGTFIHWVMYNMPASDRKLDENVPGEKALPNGTRQGVNDANRIGYMGPCPPSGTHRYYFKVYALDKMLDLQPGATKEQVLDDMKEHVLAEGQIMGRYKRTK